MFKLIEGSSALLRKRTGAYSESLCYERNKRLYVKASGGFVRVMRRIGSEPFPTSVGTIKVEEFAGVQIGDYVL